MGNPKCGKRTEIMTLIMFTLLFASTAKVFASASAGNSLSVAEGSSLAKPALSVTTASWMKPMRETKANVGGPAELEADWRGELSERGLAFRGIVKRELERTEQEMIGDLQPSPAARLSLIESHAAGMEQLMEALRLTKATGPPAYSEHEYLQHEIATQVFRMSRGWDSMEQGRAQLRASIADIEVFNGLLSHDLRTQKDSLLSENDELTHLGDLQASFATGMDLYERGRRQSQANYDDAKKRINEFVKRLDEIISAHSVDQVDADEIIRRNQVLGKFEALKKIQAFLS